MTLEILETYAQAKLDVYKAEVKLISQHNEICKLKKRLKNCKSSEDLNKYFTIYSENSIFINQDNEQELLGFLRPTREKEIDEL